MKVKESLICPLFMRFFENTNILNILNNNNKERNVVVA